MNEIQYCKRWFRATKKMREPWDEARAREAHESGAPYTVVVGDPARPGTILDVSGGLGRVMVAFLDGRLREALTYQFKSVESGKLFLAMATLREFDGQREAVLAGTSTIFEENGRATIRKEWFRPHALDLQETSLDVSANYDRFPDFGDYEALCRKERLEI